MRMLLAQLSPQGSAHISVEFEDILRHGGSMLSWTPHSLSWSFLPGKTQ